MLSVVSNLDLPDDIFDVEDKVVVHVTKCLDKAMQYGHVDMVVLFDTCKDVRRYLRSSDFEKILYDNPKVSFLTVTKRHNLTHFINDLSVDYDNVDSITFGDFAEAKITDKKQPAEVYRGFVDTVNYLFYKLFGLKDEAKQIGA